MKMEKSQMNLITTIITFVIIVFIATAFVFFSITLTGCSEAEQQSIEISKQADKFNTPRRLRVINLRSDKVILEIVGVFSIQDDTSGNHEEIDILCKVDDNKYEKHFFSLNEKIMYSVEDLSSDDILSDSYYVEYYPENEDE